MKTHLLIIDPQNSFCDPAGELCVPGAEADMKRLAEFIRARENRIDRMTVTLDSHNKIHIAHPVWWTDADGNPPEPFTPITFEEVAAGKWQAADPDDRAWSLKYMEQIRSHVIWPCHCLIGTWGHGVYEPLSAVLNQWREKYHDLDFVLKGSCRFTENFSAIRPSVPVPGDPSTALNTALLKRIDRADRILVAGEASSHCVADTVRDIVACSENPAIARKIVLLSDAMSPVPGFEEAARAFFEQMTDAGVGIARLKEVD
ncbi:hypothetical protein DENIS_1747 [Desulfonema ishimotonii]|uniref:Uncharacterized protein n=1 Tax=Desulfonema ishimotonii TaxID=45657 RepID=A0A401FV10_9BACT|nr:isochorismatase family protein [Desulfonema ishimotonii]GBC60788.1 hypothetical protein DENIS_1747 [Desulfonema ishimotonii]